MIGAFTLRDHLSFDALAENRERLLAFRDAHYLWAVLGFIAAYVVIVAFSLPGATIATLTGGFLFGVFPGVLFNVGGGDHRGGGGVSGRARRALARRLRGRIEARWRRRRAADGGLARKRMVGAVHDAADPGGAVLYRQPDPGLCRHQADALCGDDLSGHHSGRRWSITSVGAGLGEVFARGETPDLGIIFAPHVLLPILGLAALVGAADRS